MQSSALPITIISCHLPPFVCVQEMGDLDGVTCFCELAMPLAARLCERLGLASNSPAAVDAARDKHATRAVMEKDGLPTPRNMLITSAAVLDKVGAAAVMGVAKRVGPRPA